MKKPILYLVIPCYNEEEVLDITTLELTKKLNYLLKNNLIDIKSRVCLLD